eukprot:gene6431-8689_t
MRDLDRDVGRDGARKIIALEVRAAGDAQRLQLRLGLDALGNHPEAEGGGHAAAIGDAARRDDRQVGPRTDQRQQHHGGHVAAVLEAPALAALVADAQRSPTLRLKALAALNAANAGSVASYGDDPATARAQDLFRQIFETDCETFFVFNGTAANALALAALCERHHGILCHAMAHVETDECGAPEFFTGGSKVIPIDAPLAKLRPADLAPVLHRGHGVHFPKIRALSL